MLGVATSRDDGLSLGYTSNWPVALVEFAQSAIKKIVIALQLCLVRIAGQTTAQVDWGFLVGAIASVGSSGLFAF